MKKLQLSLLFLLIACASICTGYSQKVSPADKKIFAKKEDSLQVLSDSMINAEMAGKRFMSDSLFVRTLVRALKIKNSFYYPFETLQTISIQYPDDSTFRIFTWQL